MLKPGERTRKFAFEIVKLVSTLPSGSAGSILGRQLLRSGTSVEPNVVDAFSACTRREFSYKLDIALKEAKEASIA